MDVRKIKDVIRSYKSKKERQNNGKRKDDRRTGKTKAK